MDLKCRQASVETNFLRGGGCGCSANNQVEQFFEEKYNANVFDFFSKFDHYIQIIDSKALIAANVQESSEIMVAIQWFILQEENIYQLNKSVYSVRKSYDLILNGIRQLLKSCLIYAKTDQFKCLYILQVTSSLSKVIFSYHLMNTQRDMKCEVQKAFLENIAELRQQIEIEKNDLIQNQIELYLNLTQASIEIAPTDNSQRNEILKGCLSGIINSMISMSVDFELFESLYDGACLLSKKLNIPKKRKQYEIYYQIDMLQWEVIRYFKEDKFNSFETIILKMEQIYEKLVRNSKNWNDHYLWIQMIGKILTYNPPIAKLRLGQQINDINSDKKQLSQIWQDYKNKGLLIQTNRENDQAIILLHQLQNKKISELDRQTLEKFYLDWESLIQLKEFLMNDQKERLPFAFQSYLKYKQSSESQNVDTNIMENNKVQILRDFIIPRKLLDLIEQTQENITQVEIISRNFRVNEVNIKFMFSILSQQIKKIRYNLEQYFQNIQQIIQLLSLNQKKSQCEGLKLNNDFIEFQQLKFYLKVLEQSLQQLVEFIKSTNINQLEENEKLQKQITVLSSSLEFFSHKTQFSFINEILTTLITLPSLKDKNLMKVIQLILKQITDSMNQINFKESQFINNHNIIIYFKGLIDQIYQYQEQIELEYKKELNHSVIFLKEIFILQYEIEISSFPEAVWIKNIFQDIKLIQFVHKQSLNLLGFKLKLLSFREALQFFLIPKNQIEQETLNCDQILKDAVKNYHQRIITCNIYDQKQIIFEDQRIETELTHFMMRKLPKYKGIIQYLFFQCNVELQAINSEMKDLELIDKEYENLFEEEFSLSSLIQRVKQVLGNFSIDKSISNIEKELNEQLLQTEKENYANLLNELNIINHSLKLQILKELIKEIEVGQILIQSLKNSVDKIYYKILLCYHLKKLQRSISEITQKLEIIEKKKNSTIEQDQENINENLDDKKIKNPNGDFKTLFYCLKKIGILQNIAITKKKQFLEKMFVEIKQLYETIELLQKQYQQDFEFQAFESFYRFLNDEFRELELLQRTNFSLEQLENENFIPYFNRIQNNLLQEFGQAQFENQGLQQNQFQEKNISDFLIELKNDVKKLIKEKFQSNQIQIKEDFILLQLQKFNLTYLEEGVDENVIQQDSNDDDIWKIKQGLVFSIIQISSNCFTDSIISFCQKILIQFWAEEKDQRVRNILKNQGLLSIQMQIFQRDWKTQHDRIEGEMQSMLKAIDDLQEQISREANLQKRDEELKQLDEITQQLEEYIENISEMGQQLRLITDFVNHIKKGLARVEGKINEMKQQLDRMDNDIKFLRGKTVDQLLEIRKWKVLQEAAKKNVKSIYVPLKTYEVGQHDESILINLEQINDKYGEVNEFLLENKQTVLLIHGRAGSGKSTIAKKIEEFIWKLHEKKIKINQVVLVPIYISLPSLRNPIFQAVEEALKKDEYGFDDLQLKECKEKLIGGEFRFLLIMDSYDEMKLENLQKNLYISNKLKQNWSNPLVIFTTRNEIFQGNNYTEWFAPEKKDKLKEIRILNFQKEQKKEYLEKFANLSIKILIFDTQEWLTQIQNRPPIGVKKFEISWEKLEIQLLKENIQKGESDLLLNEKQIKNILLFLKDDCYIALKNSEAIRSLEINLNKLWSVSKYENIMKLVNLDKLVKTPYMMEIIVQVLPLMLARASDIAYLKQNFINNFSQMIYDALRNIYATHIMKVERKKYFRDKIKDQEENNFSTQLAEDVFQIDINKLGSIDYHAVALKVWDKMEQNQIPAQFMFYQDLSKLKIKLFHIFEQENISDFLLARKDGEPEIENKIIVDLICDALKEQNLTNFDFYDEFIKQYHLKQIDKLRNLGKSINNDRFLHDLYQYQIKLAKVMSSKQLTQVQYKQQGLLYKDLNTEDEWQTEFFNDDGVNGSYKKDVRSCSFIQQKSTNFQFTHKSIQEFLVAVDLYEVLVFSKGLDSQTFSFALKILSKKGKTDDCAAFLSDYTTNKQQNSQNQIDYQLNFDLEQKLNFIENKLTKICNLIKTIKKHDFNINNYSTEIYTGTKKFIIKKIQNEMAIIECLKFFVQLTAIDKSFIQCGSNSLNLLAQMKIDMSKQCFKNIKIQNTSLVGTNFAKCNLSGSEFDNVNIEGINLSQALLINCKWKNLKMNELHRFNGHRDYISSLCFSPDGTILASSSFDMTTRLWDVKTGQLKQLLEGSTYSLCFSPDSKKLVCAGEEIITIWDVKLGQLKQQIDVDGDEILSVCYSPNGIILASGSSNNFVCLWDAKTGNQRFQLKGHDRAVTSVCCSPDSTKLASGSFLSIFLWDVQTGEKNQELHLDSRSTKILSICFSTDGQTLMSGSKDKVQIWDVKTGREKAHSGLYYGTNSICFSSDGAILACGRDNKSIVIVDLKKGRLKQILEGHNDSVTGVCFSPNSNLLASGSYDKSIRLWNVETQQKVAKENGHSDAVQSVCFSPDGATLASSSDDGTIRLWEKTTGKLKLQIDLEDRFFKQVCFSTDGNELASWNEKLEICIWYVRTGKEKCKILAHKEDIYTLCYSPDGTEIASGSKDHSIRIWDLNTKQLKCQLDCHMNGVTSVCYSPDGAKLVSGSFDNSICIMNAETRKLIFRLEGHSGKVFSVCFSLDGTTLASGSKDKTICLWDVETGQQKSQLQGHLDEVTSICFSPDGTTLASGSHDNSVRFWDVQSGQQKQQINGHSDFVTSICYSPDGTTLASGSFDTSIRIWDMMLGQHKLQLNNLYNQVTSVCFSPDGNTLAAGGHNKSIQIWNVKTGKEKLQLSGHTDIILTVCYSPDGILLASGSKDMSIRLWDINKGEQQSQLNGHNDSVQCVTFSFDGASLATGSLDKLIILWDVKTGQIKQQLNGHKGQVHSVCFSYDNTILASGGMDKLIILWDVMTGTQQYQINENTEGVCSIGFSPDSSILAYGSVDKLITLWDMKMKSKILQLSGHSDQVCSVCFSPDGSKIASSSWDNYIIIWDAKTGEQKLQIQGHSDIVYQVCISPDGQTLASGSKDMSICLWDMNTGKQLSQLNGHSDCVQTVDFSLDGSKIAAGSFDNTIHIWDSKTGKEKSQLIGHSDYVLTVRFSPDGNTLASGGGDKSIRIWDIKIYEEKSQLNGHSNTVCSLSFSSDGLTLASSSWDLSIRLWDVFKRQQKYQINTDKVCSVFFSPDGMALASWTGEKDKLICLWDVQNRNQISKDKNDYQKVYAKFNKYNFSQENNIIQILSISKQIQFQIADALIYSGNFLNHLSKSQESFFQQKGGVILQNQYA